MNHGGMLGMHGLGMGGLGLGGIGLAGGGFGMAGMGLGGMDFPGSPGSMGILPVIAQPTGEDAGASKGKKSKVDKKGKKDKKEEKDEKGFKISLKGKDKDKDKVKLKLKGKGKTEKFIVPETESETESEAESEAGSDSEDSASASETSSQDSVPQKAKKAFKSKKKAKEKERVPVKQAAAKASPSQVSSPSGGAGGEPTATWSDDPDINAEVQARKEHEWAVEKKKREMAFTDMSKDLREELRGMRDKYETIIKFDSAVHMSLEDHRERMKIKQDEADHYIDSKLYEKQKTFDREVEEIKLKAKESDDNYVKTMDSYKDVVSKLDSECHRLEKGWDDSRKEVKERDSVIEAMKEASLQALKESQQKHDHDINTLRKEMETMQAAHMEATQARNEEKEKQDTEMRITKNINMQKVEANKKLTDDLRISDEALSHAKEKAVAAMFRLKSTSSEKDAVEAQLERLKDAAVQLKKDLTQSREKYDEIVLWAKTTEDAQKKHDDEVKKNMNAQHDKFNVEYDFLCKQNSALKDEIRNLKHEVQDGKSYVAMAEDKLKNSARDIEDSKRKCKIAEDHAEKMQITVDFADKKYDQMQRKLELTRERDLKLQENEMTGELTSMKKKVDIKSKLVEEMEHKTEFLRNKIKSLEDIVMSRDKKIDALEEQVAFEGRMREMNMQKRMEHENGGIDAVVSLLRINEMNAANLDRITETNAVNLDTVRKDIAGLVTKINTETVAKKKTNAKLKLKAVADIVKNGHEAHEAALEKKAKEEAGIPRRKIDLNKAQLHMSRSKSPDRKELIKHAHNIPEQADGVFKDGYGRPITDPFHPSLSMAPPDPVPFDMQYANENYENNHNNQKPLTPPAMMSNSSTFEAEPALTPMEVPEPVPVPEKKKKKEKEKKT